MPMSPLTIPYPVRARASRTEAVPSRPRLRASNTSITLPRRRQAAGYPGWPRWPLLQCFAELLVIDVPLVNLVHFAVADEQVVTVEHVILELAFDDDPHPFGEQRRRGARM